MARYNSTKKLNNSNEYYRELRQKRNNIKNIRHYETPIMRHPTISERASMQTVQHVWTLGDRLYKLSHEYYRDASFWWVIAWYNGRPTEADFKPGDLITIPLDIQSAIETFGI